jgi:hypothetical protein
MVQKSFTMWPRINSSTASTVNFLTHEDKRFICFLEFLFRHTSATGGRNGIYGLATVSAGKFKQQAGTLLVFGTSNPHGASYAGRTSSTTG